MRMFQWKDVEMERGKVFATLPLSQGEPSSVLSPLSNLSHRPHPLFMIEDILICSKILRSLVSWKREREM